MLTDEALAALLFSQMLPDSYLDFFLILPPASGISNYVPLI
jgi:hypothetical protein